MGLTGLSTTDMNQAFVDIAKAGGTTVRTWYVQLNLNSEQGLMTPSGVSTR